jgi:hypothetical protein
MPRQVPRKEVAANIGAKFTALLARDLSIKISQSFHRTPAYTDNLSNEPQITRFARCVIVLARDEVALPRRESSFGQQAFKTRRLR